MTVQSVTRRARVVCRAGQQCYGKGLRRPVRQAARVSWSVRQRRPHLFPPRWGPAHLSAMSRRRRLRSVLRRQCATRFSPGRVARVAAADDDMWGRVLAAATIGLIATAAAVVTRHVAVAVVLAYALGGGL